MKIFGLIITTAKKQKLMQDVLEQQSKEIIRLREIEEKYNKLTDRDEKGRYKA